MFCPNCGKQSANDANFCSSCGAVAAASLPGRALQTRIVRPRHPRMVAGVCSGFAIYYGWDIALVRILFAVFTCLTSGFGLLLYFAAWVIMPDAPYALPPTIYATQPPPPSVPTA